MGSLGHTRYYSHKNAIEEAIIIIFFVVMFESFPKPLAHRTDYFAAFRSFVSSESLSVLGTEIKN